MNVKKNCTRLLAALAFLFSMAVYGQTYLVKKIPAGSLTIDGKGDAGVWQRANRLNHFICPWDSTTLPSTSFSALWDGQWFYCLYKVTDDSVIVYTNTNEKKETGASDRVEIFFKADDKMSPYYCLEMDAAGRILDYNADFYRQMHYNWQWPKDQLMVKTSRTKKGYMLEAAISIASLQTLGLLKEKQLQAGLFRAERTGTENGRPLFKWISWIDPKSAQPDFHIPAAFGLLKLE